MVASILQLTNHSPTIEQVILALVVPLLLLVFKNSSDIAKIHSDIKHLEKRFELELKHTNQNLERFELELRHTNQKLDSLHSEFIEFKNYVYQKL